MIAGASGVVVHVLHVFLEILFRRKLDCAGGADRDAAVAEHDTLVGVGDQELRAVDAFGIGGAGLEDAGLAEHLAVGTAVAEVRIDGGIPGDLLPGNEQALFSFSRCLGLGMSGLAGKDLFDLFLPGLIGLRNVLFKIAHGTGFQHHPQRAYRFQQASIAGGFFAATEKTIKDQHSSLFVY